MSWKEVSPGRFERPLGENEKFIKLIGDRAHAAGREHWSVTATASFTIKHHPPPSDLHITLLSAWKVFRFQHPSIATTASSTNILSYYVPTPSTLNAWANRTLTIHPTPTKTTTDDIIANLTPSPYMTAHVIPNSSSTFQIILHTAHWRTDGYGILHLLSAFLSSLSTTLTIPSPTIPWGTEHTRLTPSIETALSLPTTSSPHISAVADTLLATVAHTKGAIGVKYNGTPTTPPHGTRSIHTSFSSSETELIVAACAEKGLCVPAAVHASVAAINYHFAPPAPDERDRHYTSTIRMGLRPYLPAPYGEPAYGAALYTGGYLARVEANSSWRDRASFYQTEYDNAVTEEFLLARKPYAEMVLEMVKMPPMMGDGRVQSEVDVSNVGDAEALVERRYGGERGKGGVEVWEVGVGVETLTRQMYVFVWTFRGRLQFRCVFNEAFYEGSFVRGLVERLKDGLAGELGVGLGETE